MYNSVGVITNVSVKGIPQLDAAEYFMESPIPQFTSEETRHTLQINTQDFLHGQITYSYLR